MYPKRLSLVIPVFNEQDRLKSALKIIKKYQKKFPNWQFVFVDDGSTDKTKSIIEKSGFEVISYPKNQGKGFALKRGVLKANQPLCLITDIDFSTPLSELPKLYQEMEKNYQIVIGSRKVKGAKVTKHQPKLREWLGARFTDLSNLCLGLNVTDFTCGFKLFKMPVAKKIFKAQRIKRWGYDSEIIFLASLVKVKIKEVPVVWHNDERTRVNLGKDVLRSFWDLVLIRVYQLLGSYR